MKKIKKYLLLTSVFISLSLIVTSCYDLEDDSAPTPVKVRSTVHSEKDFLADTTLYSLPGEIVVVNLEHLNTPADSIKAGTDTDGIGVDIYSFKIKDTVNISFRIDTTTYIIEMYEKQTGKKVLLLNTDIRQRIRRYDPGDYMIHITSLLNYDDDTLNNQLIFIQPDVSLTKSGGDNEIFWLMESRVRKCKECNLQYYDFSGFDLSLIDLTEARLNYAIMKGASLPLANLSNADLSYCDLSNAYLREVTLFNALLEKAILNHADLRDADLEYADLTKASLRYSNAIGANFCFTVRTGWDTTGIIIDSTTLCLP